QIRSGLGAGGDLDAAVGHDAEQRGLAERIEERLEMRPGEVGQVEAVTAAAEAPVAVAGDEVVRSEREEDVADRALRGLDPAGELGDAEALVLAELGEEPRRLIDRRDDPVRTLCHTTSCG